MLMETPIKFISCTRILMLCVLIGLNFQTLAQDKVDQIIDEGIQRNEAARQSQQKVDAIASETDKVVAEYKRVLKVIDGLKVYNALLQRQLDDQQATIAQIKESIAEVSVIERQITPLMLRMVDSLEQFVEMDVPFLLKERKDRIERLNNTITRADVTTAEKFRSVLEAYQIEIDYGRNIEAYKDVLEIGGNPREVSFFRMGRVTLVYQTEDREYNGVWDQANRKWVPLDGAEYRNNIANALKIAREQVAPDLIILPINAPEGS